MAPAPAPYSLPCWDILLARSMEASRSKSQVVCYVSQLALKTQVLLMVPSWFLS